MSPDHPTAYSETVGMLTRPSKPPDHDYHHQSFSDCYSSSLRWLDTLLGTDQKYHKFRNTQRQAKADAEAKKAL